MANYSPTPADIYRWSLQAVQDAVAAITATFMVLDRTPIGAINGVNLAFTTPSNFTAPNLIVYLNGQRLCPTDDFTISAPNSFTMILPPYPGDKLRVDYIPA